MVGEWVSEEIRASLMCWALGALCWQVMNFVEPRDSLVMSGGQLLRCWFEECPDLLGLVGKGNPTLFQNLEGSLGALLEFPFRGKETPG